MLAMLGLAALLVGCAQNGARSSPTAVPAPSVSASDNGRQIFLTGRDSAGRQIAASPAATRSSCAACHGANGAGGVHFPDGAVSADLRHNALVTAQHPPYTLALLERAISKGVDNQGKPLDPVMPRWKLSSRDLHDVAEYVLTRLR